MFSRSKILIYVVLGILLSALTIMLLESDKCNCTTNPLTKRGRPHSGTFGVKTRTRRMFDPALPVIYTITPTYARIEQKAELTRLSQTFLHLSNFHWILVEDSVNKTRLVTNLLRSSGLSYTHLNALTPPQMKLKATDARFAKPRGVWQRNAGLSWIRDNLNPETQSGVVYFADDDNTYDLRIFAEMRMAQKVAVWPVGFTGHLKYGGPVVTNGKVTGWLTGLTFPRPFAIDMAGFAINLRLFFQYPEAKFTYKVSPGLQESTILERLNIILSDFEPVADNGTKVLVWHTRTMPPILDAEATNIEELLQGPYFTVEV
ncbi:galactosylgalactosylxylosylprotein 3-beta-glucuronosyltransferase 1-like [Haliotis rubra]|uniref:galactosylgalactosylxylosylprotein 3-beta-glucuronosyltransferase 1-like n=1 Tax=Haliotis rubra TaxID=36100 RepID=UPI001EE543AF|nr:galactosylgalactosylxylosylprotein 3-beta-glucuronosyltransferase 1-like [Haliotis rubra]